MIRIGLRAGSAAVARRDDVEHPVRRHQGVGNHDIVAAGRRETDRAPGVLDLVLLAMQEQEMRGDAGTMASRIAPSQ